MKQRNPTTLSHDTSCGAHGLNTQAMTNASFVTWLFCSFIDLFQPLFLLMPLTPAPNPAAVAPAVCAGGGHGILRSPIKGFTLTL